MEVIKHRPYHARKRGHFCRLSQSRKTAKTDSAGSDDTHMLVGLRRSLVSVIPNRIRIPTANGYNESNASCPLAVSGK